MTESANDKIKRDLKKQTKEAKLAPKVLGKKNKTSKIPNSRS